MAVGDDAFGGGVVGEEETLSYDESKKVWKDKGGRSYVSVITAIRECGLMDLRYSDELAMIRGTETHGFIENVLRGKLDFQDVPNPLEHLVDAFARFVEDFRPEPLMIERRLKDSLYGFCGQVDLVCKIHDGSVAVVDYKTGVPMPFHSLQTAGYARLVEGFWGDGRASDDIRRFSIYLGRNGNYKSEEHPDRYEDDSMFMAAVSLCHWKRKKGLK